MKIMPFVVKESVGIKSGFTLSITKTEVKNPKRDWSLKWSKKNWSPTELVTNLFDFDRSLKWPKKGWVIGHKAMRVWAKVRARLASHEEHNDRDGQIEIKTDFVWCSQSHTEDKCSECISIRNILNPSTSASKPVGISKCLQVSCVKSWMMLLFV